MQPVVGITCYETEATWGPRTERATMVSQIYVDAVRRAGGTPVVLPPAVPEEAPEILRRLDALVLSGGGDADPARYDATAHAQTWPEEPAREEWELALLATAFAVPIPVLGICRGAQLLNVACKGDLDQHVPDTLGHERHLPGPARYGDQRLKVEPDSLIGHAVGASATVLCHHHQGFGRLGEGVRAVAWAEDGIVEGIEVEGLPFVAGAQWHPERSDDHRLYRALVAATQ